MAATSLAICKRAAQILGAGQANLTNIDTPSTYEDTEFGTAYPLLRDSELRKHRWNFAKTFAAITPAANTPTWPWEFKYALPADCLAVTRLRGVTDFDVTATHILANVSDSDMVLEYTKQVTDPTLFDPLFDEALAAKLAYEMCETITQSNTKKQEALQHYEDQIAWARRTNAIERGATPRAVPAEWVAVRR